LNLVLLVGTDRFKINVSSRTGPACVFGGAAPIERSVLHLAILPLRGRGGGEGRGY
jgi:hypothetical protein